MTLSIVIVSYKVKELLDNCLKSIESSAKDIDHEVYVVDNQSEDGTVQLVEKKYPKVKLISNKNNLGFSKANNQALKKTKGDYILILNPDTQLVPETLNKMLAFAKGKGEELGAATCRVELPSGELDKDCRRSFPTPFRAFAHFSGLSRIFKGTKLFDSYYVGYIKEDQETEVDACVGAFMLTKSSVLKKVGLFDEDFFFYGEDLDLCYRINKAGFKIFYTPITKIIHHKGASSGIKKHSEELSYAPKESRKRAIAESTRAMELFYKKHYSKKYPIFITAPVLFAVEILKYIRLVRISLQ